MEMTELVTASWLTAGLIVWEWLYGLFIVRKASQQVTQFGVQTKSTIKIQNEIIIPKEKEKKKQE